MVGIAGGLFTFMFGAWNSALETLLTLIALDYISGMLAAYINPNLALDSRRGYKGIARKVFILLIVAVLIVAVAHGISVSLNSNEIYAMAIYFYIANEGLSITENAAKAGVPIPTRIVESLEQLTQQKKAREKPEE
ncbi:phage holin family protein [Selenomonas caprae]|uniref:Phage holin family protein n=1 Tax=Selenomonas caprae TaxID=2606905 RepID=A0A5D6WCG8_9FIRM|nr:phage holin family protein [Selenomonas caprae]